MPTDAPLVTPQQALQSKLIHDDLARQLRSHLAELGDLDTFCEAVGSAMVDLFVNTVGPRFPTTWFARMSALMAPLAIANPPALPCPTFSAELAERAAPVQAELVPLLRSYLVENGDFAVVSAAIGSAIAEVLVTEAQPGFPCVWFAQLSARTAGMAKIH